MASGIASRNGYECIFSVDTAICFCFFENRKSSQLKLKMFACLEILTDPYIPISSYFGEEIHFEVIMRMCISTFLRINSIYQSRTCLS